MADLLARGAAESRKRAAVLRQLAAQHHDDSLLTPAATADAEADLLDVIAHALDTGFEGAAEYWADAQAYDAIKDAADALARLLVKEN